MSKSLFDKLVDGRASAPQFAMVVLHLRTVPSSAARCFASADFASLCVLEASAAARPPMKAVLPCLLGSSYRSALRWPGIPGLRSASRCPRPSTPSGLRRLRPASATGGLRAPLSSFREDPTDFRAQKLQGRDFCSGKWDFPEQKSPHPRRTRRRGRLVRERASVPQFAIVALLRYRLQDSFAHWTSASPVSATGGGEAPSLSRSPMGF